MMDEEVHYDEGRPCWRCGCPAGWHPLEGSDSESFGCLDCSCSETHESAHAGPPDEDNLPEGSEPKDVMGCDV